MAESKYKGLLYSPEVLGGIGLLTSGLSGGSPNQALPSLLQGMQTASMFRKMEDEEEKRQFIKDYEDQVPEEDKAAFRAFPKEYVSKYLFAKDKALKTKTIVKDGVYKTVDVTNKSGQTDFSNLIKDGWVESPVTAKASEAGLTKKSQGKTEDIVLSGTQLLNNLTLQEVLFEDEFLTIGGKAKYAYLKGLEVAGKELKPEERAYIANYSEWQQTNLQYFNQYRKEITGVAAGEKEIGWLQESIPSEKDTPTTYKAKIKNQIRIQKQLIANAEKFRATGGKLYETNDKGERVYSKEFGKYLSTKIKPNGEYLYELMESYTNEKMWDLEKSRRVMDLNFEGVDWESILDKYLEEQNK